MNRRKAFAALATSLGVALLGVSVAANATPSHPTTKTVSWDTGLAAGVTTPHNADDVTWPQSLDTGQCGDSWIQIDVYAYDTKVHKATVDALLAAGVLNKPGQSGSDSSVVLSWSFVKQTKCDTTTLPPTSTPPTTEPPTSEPPTSQPPTTSPSPVAPEISYSVGGDCTNHTFLLSYIFGPFNGPYSISLVGHSAGDVLSVSPDTFVQSAIPVATTMATLDVVVHYRGFDVPVHAKFIFDKLAAGCQPLPSPSVSASASTTTGGGGTTTGGGTSAPVLASTGAGKVAAEAASGFGLVALGLLLTFGGKRRKALVLGEDTPIA